MFKYRVFQSRYNPVCKLHVCHAVCPSVGRFVFHNFKVHFLCSNRSICFFIITIFEFLLILNLYLTFISSSIHLCIYLSFYLSILINLCSLIPSNMHIPFLLSLSSYFVFFLSLSFAFSGEHFPHKYVQICRKDLNYYGRANIHNFLMFGFLVINFLPLLLHKLTSPHIWLVFVCLDNKFGYSL